MPPGLNVGCTYQPEVPKCVTYRPTWEEFKDFDKFLKYVESQGAHKAGIIKVVPPEEWIPRKEGYDLDGFNYTIDAPVKQQFKLADEKGSYQTKGSIQEPMTVKQYAKLANDGVYKQPPHSNHDELERKYWKTLSFCPPIYGCDVADSLTDSDQKAWNMADLKTILNYVNDDYNQQLKGVNSPYLYFGMWKATFGWHVEDMDLYSINYLHHGAPKTWYCVPPQYGYLLEAAARQLFPDVASWCSNFMRHKTCLISPQVLDKMGVPYQKVVQEERNAIIVFPYAYHSGFNHGFNIAESTNFALERWIEYGKRARQCDCQRSRVMFSMDTFVKRYQPELWESWKKGTDIKPHPEDPPDVVAKFDLRKANPKEYARLKQEQFLKRNVKYKSPVKVRPNYSDAKSKETKITPDHSSQDTKLYYVYQHHEYSNVKVTVDPDTMAIFGNGKDLLEKFIDADDIDVRDLIENSILIKIGDKVQNNPVESEIARKVAKLPAVKELVHVYQHFELSITARINPKTMELEGSQSNELQEYLKDQRDIKQLISLGIFKFTYEEYSTDSAYKSISDSNITDKDTYDKTLTIHNNMGTFTPNQIDKTMELMDLITGHIYMDLTSNELVTYLPKCQKFVGTVTDRMVHLFNGKSIHDLVQEGKLVKVGQRRLCPEEALSLVTEKVKLNRCVLNLKVGNACELLAVEVATHQSIPNRIVFAISRGNDDMKYDEAKRALENNAIKNLLDENILVKPLNNSCKRSNYNVKGEILLSALQHECKLTKCSDHIDELKTMASTINSSGNTNCKCALTGLLPLRRALLGNRTKTASKSLIIRVQEYCNTVSMENRPSDELYIVKEGSLPSDFTLDEYKSDEEHAEDENGGEQSLQTLTDETANSNGTQTRRKRKLIDIDDIRDPYDSEEGEAEIIPKFDSDESKGEESSDDPDYGEKGSNSYQWRSKRVAKKKKSKHLVPAASRVGVPGFVLDNRRDSVDKSAGNKSKKVLPQTADPSLLSTANALINYFEDDENLDEDFNLIFYSKELAKKLGQESHQFLEVLKIFKEFQIVTRVMKKPQDKEQLRFEWNGIEECNLNEVLLQIYHGKKDDMQDKESQLWEVCVDILKTLTHSRKNEGHTVYNLTEHYTPNEISIAIRALSVLESIKLVKKKIFDCSETIQHYYVYRGTDFLGQDIAEEYDKYRSTFNLKNPKLLLAHDNIPKNKFQPYVWNDVEQLSESSVVVSATTNGEEKNNVEEKIRSVANKDRVCHCGYDKRMEVKVNRDGQNSYLKKTVRTGFKKRSRCKQCKGCLAPKCGRCTPCLRPAMKKPCVDKICLFPVVPNCPCFS